MTDTERLLPCPFCGGEASAEVNIVGGWSGECECDDCIAGGPIRDTKTAAITAWNTRQQDQPADGLVEAVKDFRQAATDLWCAFSLLLSENAIAYDERVLSADRKYVEAANALSTSVEAQHKESAS